MKHPNKKVEAIRKEYAWALMAHKRMQVKSCFEWWLSEDYLKPVSVKQFSKDTLIEALKNI